jgi:hypothetical protein
MALQEVSRKSSPQESRRRMIHKANRPPSPEELKHLLIMAFCMGMVITAAYFVLFVVK